MKIFKWLVALWVMLALAACGGGGGSAGTQASASGQAAAVVSSFVYQLSKNALTNSGADYTVLTVTALDSSNNPVPGAKVVVDPSKGDGIYTPDASVTDAKGVVTGKLTINPNNKSDRDITSVITVGSKTATVVVPVTGSQILLTLVPATPAPGESVSLDVKVIDVNGAAIPYVDVELSGTLGFAGTKKTGVSGSILPASLNVSSTPGSYTVEAAGSGVTASKTVQIVSPTGGTIPVVPSATDFSAASLSASPNTIAPNVAGSTVNRSTLKAIFQDPSNQAIRNVRVRFDIVSPSLGADEKISTGATTVYSDANGVASAEYIAGSRSSPTNGVLIRACYGRTDAELAAGACPPSQSVQTNLTVATSPLSITIGDDNTMETGNNGLTYIKDFDIAVADSAGYAITGAVLSVSVDIPRYRKAAAYNSVDPNQIWCLNEDTNRNGFVDKLPLNEDVNNNGKLEPRKADIVVYFAGSNKTDETGRARIKAEWAQNLATWLQYVVKVTTNVEGSEGKAEKSFVTQFIDADEKNGAFRIPQYGSVLNCSNPN